jgi:hypothetical protein
VPHAFPTTISRTASQSIAEPVFVNFNNFSTALRVTGFLPRWLLLQSIRYLIIPYQTFQALHSQRHWPTVTCWPDVCISYWRAIFALSAANVRLYLRHIELRKGPDNIPTYFLLELELPTGTRGHYIVTDLINALPGNSSVNTNRGNNRRETVFSMPSTQSKSAEI